MEKEKIEKLAEKEYPTIFAFMHDNDIALKEQKAFIKGYQQAQEEQNRKAAMINPRNLDDVLTNKRSFF
jgi:hypothetical protein